MNGKPITTDERMTILRMRRAGYLVAEIVKHTGRKASSVKAVLSAAQERAPPAVCRMRRRIHIAHALSA